MHARGATPLFCVGCVSGHSQNSIFSSIPRKRLSLPSGPTWPTAVHRGVCIHVVSHRPASYKYTCRSMWLSVHAFIWIHTKLPLRPCTQTCVCLYTPYPICCCQRSHKSIQGVGIPKSIRVHTWATEVAAVLRITQPASF